MGRAALEETDRLVLGVRDLTLPQVPPRSKLGNRLTSWAFHLLYGVRLADTQTGLRGIPWGMLAWCGEIRGERFEYEMNMLIRAAREHRELRQSGIPGGSSWCWCPAWAGIRCLRRPPPLRMCWRSGCAVR